ncbi:MAG: RodZ domain-containing protein [Dissulfurispiraceae bacterium]|jgi:cytoskeletal protein RodZ
MSKFLKERRKELGKEIPEIASVTRIKGSYLRSIEEEEFDKLPVEVYTRGYIKEYAEFLGIPADIALEPYENYTREKKSGKEKKIYNEIPVATLTKESDDSLDAFEDRGDLEHMDILLSPEVTFCSSQKTLLFKILWIFPVAAVAAVIYFLIPSMNSAPPAPEVKEPVVQGPEIAPPPASVSPQPPPVLSRTPDGNPAAKSIKTPEGTKSKEKVPVPKDAKDKGLAALDKTRSQADKSSAAKWKHTLNIDAVDKVWVRVVIDGTEQKGMLLNHGDKVSYGANKSFAVIVGNAAGANILFDGKPFENLGAEGEVVRLNFPLSTGQQPTMNQKDQSDSPIQPQPSGPLPSNQAPDAPQ